MDKNVLLDKFDRFCAGWIKKAELSLTITEILQHTLSQVLPGLIHMSVEHLDDEKIIGSVPYRQDTANVLGYMHGGTIFTTGDTLVGAFLWTRIEANQYAVTTRCEIKYVKPLKGGILRCTVTEKSRKDRNVVLEALFEDENGKNYKCDEYGLSADDYRPHWFLIFSFAFMKSERVFVERIEM